MIRTQFYFEPEMKNCLTRRFIYHWIVFGLLAITLFGVTLFDAYAQQPNSIGENSSSHFIRRWLALGPFIEGEPAPKAIEVDYLKQATGMLESQFATLSGAPKAGDSVALTLEGYATQVRGWTVLELPEDDDVNRMLVEEGEVDYAFAYLLTFIESKEATGRELMIGSDDAVKVWLNGEVVHTVVVDRPLMPDQDWVFVDLKEGMNCLMLKAADSEKEWGLAARFEDESDLQFFDTSTRQLIPLGKRLIRLRDPQLETLKPEPGMGTEGVWKTYRYVDGLASNNVHAILQDKEGAIWFGTYFGGVSRFDGKNWKTYAEKDGLACDYVDAIIQDKEGAMWVGTQDGVSWFDGKSWKTYTQKDGLAGNYVRTVLQGKEGAMWFGTPGGVSRFDGKSWITYTQKDGLADNYVNAIMEDKEGAMWFGTLRGGVSQFDGKSWITYTQKDGLASNDVRAIIQDKEGAIWFGTLGGVSRFDGKNWKTHTKKDGLIDKRVLSILQDKEGAMWFGTSGGVSRFDGKSWTTYTQNDGLADNLVHAILQDKEGAIWFGTVYDGVSRYDGKNWKTYTKKDGLVNNYISSIIQDKEGAIWFGTLRGGVSRYDFDTPSATQSKDGVSWKTYTKKDGLADRYVNAIMEDNDGNIWFGTNAGGVSRFDGRCFQTIDSRDGLASDSVNCVYMDRSGHIWLGTSAGAVRFIPNKIPPPVYITQIFADEKTYSRPGESFNLSSDVTRVAFNFHAISFKTRPGAMKYFYQLVGKDSDPDSGDGPDEIGAHWQGPTNQETVEYFNLKPGEYTFKVQAVDRDLNYSEPVSVHITIPSPPFYTRAGFIVGAIFATFLIPTITYALLLARQKRQQVFEPIPNPYIVGNPIRSKEMFFGREDDFRFIRDKFVGSPTGLIVVLAGERRSGKTSILYQILNGRLGERFVPVFIDMQAMAVRDDAEFFKRLAEETNRTLNAQMPIEGYDFRSAEHPAQVFQRYVDDVMEMLAENTLLFLIDEYELLETKVEEGTLRPESLTFLAGLLERHPRLALLFTGSCHLEDRRAEFWRILLPKSIARHISFLSEKDTRRLVEAPIKGTVKFRKGVPDSIYRVTAGQPFYAQVVCQNLIDHLNAEERYVISLDDVEMVVREIEENPLPQMLYFWESFSQDQQVALSALAELQENPNQSVSVKDILGFVSEYEMSMSFTEAEWRGALEGLCRRDIVERTSDKGEYQFKIDLFRPWVKHQHSIWEI